MATDNISKFYQAFNAKYDNFNNEQEFRDFLKGAKRENIDNLYNAFNNAYDNFGSADDMISYLGWSDSAGKQQAEPQQAAPKRSLNVSRNPSVEQAYQQMMAPKQEEKPVEQPQAQPQPQPAPAPVEETTAQEPEVNPFPYSGGLEEEQQEIAALRETVAEDAAFVEEYEKRRDADRKRNQMVSGVNPLAGAANRGADAKWLKENEARYKEAKSNVAKVERAVSGTENAIAASENKIAQRKNREEMASPQEIIATGRTAFGRDNAGRTDSEHELRKAADELYASADKEYDKSSKYQEGYEGNAMEQLWTGVKDFVADAGNNFDSGSLTFGLSKGHALTKAREVGDKYNSIIDGALKDMGMSDDGIKSVLSSIEENGAKLQSLEEELQTSSAEIDAMADTYENMARRGDPDAEAYGRDLQKKIDAYNKRINEEYKPTWDAYDSDRKAYEDVMAAIDAAVESGMTGGEKALLDALEKFTQAKTLRSDDVSVAGKAGAGAEQSAEFMLDFILTGGISKAGTKVATKIATNRALKKYGAEALKELAAKGKTISPGLGLRMATDAATTLGRMAVMSPRTLQAYGENLTEYSGKDEAGRIDFDRSQANALANSLLSQYIEYWSEGFGEYFGEAEQALFRSVTKKAPAEAIGKTLKGYRGSIGQYLDKGKFDGMFNEMLEEVVGSTFNALAGWMSGDRVGDAGAMKEFFAGENLATLALSFLPMSAIGAATNMSAYHKMKERYDKGAEAMDRFVKSGAISQEELQQLAKDIPELTPAEVKDKIVDITDRARKANGGRLPSDFTQNLLGYLEGEFAMGLRYDEWEDSQEKMSVVNAYTASYTNPDARASWDLNNNEQTARQAAVDAGFTEEELDNDSYMLAQEAFEIKGTQPERADALMNYASAKAAAEGLRRGYTEQTQQVSEIFDERVRRNVDTNGTVTTATIMLNGKPRTVFITQEDASVDANGNLTTPTGPDGVVRYRLNEMDKEGKTAPASQFSNVKSTDTTQFIDDWQNNFQRSRAAYYEAAQNTVSPTGQAQAISEKVGQSVVVTDHNGVYQPFKVERMTNGGTNVVLSGDKKALQGVAEAMGMRVPTSGYLEAPVTSLYPILAKEEDGSLTAGPDEKTEQEAPAAPAEEQAADLGDLRDQTVPIFDEGQVRNAHVIDTSDGSVVFEELDENGDVMRTVRLPEADFARAMQEAANPTPAAEETVAAEEAPAEEPAAPAIPVDEKGRKVYDAPGVAVEDALADLYNTPGLTEEQVDQYIAQQAAKAEAARNPEMGDMTPEEWGQATMEAARVADFWSAVQQAAQARKQPAQQEEATPAKQRPAPEAPVDMSIDSRRRVVSRLKNWARRTGVKVNIVRNVDEVKDVAAKKALKEGRALAGWFNEKTGEVEVFLPNVPNITEADKTFIHETVAHKGLLGLLGRDGYNELCDRVWDELMTPEEQAEFLYYNRHLQGSEEYLRRAAADEYIARLSENLDMPDKRNIFERIIDWIMDRLGLGGNVADIEKGAAEKATGEGSLTRSDLYDLLEDSLKRFEKGRKKLNTESLPAEIQEEMRDKGLVMDGGAVMDEQQGELKKATGYQTPNELDMESSPEVGNVRFSESTMPAWARNYMTYADAKKHVVQVLENFVRDVAADELVHGMVPTGVYKYGEKSSGSFSGPLRTNIEYIVTFDMDTSCPRSLQYLEYVNQIEAKIGRPLTQRESVQLIEMMRMYGQMIPCVYCYCENKRQALKQYYTDFMRARTGVINAKTEEEALAAMYGHNTTAEAQESNDPAVVLTPAALEVFKKWREEKDYNPTIEQLWYQYKNDRNVILTVLDNMLDSGAVSTDLSDQKITNALCKDLGITGTEANGAVRDIVSEWKWDRIEDRRHNNFTRIEDEDDLVVDNRTLTLWREMTSYGKSASGAKNVLRYVPYTDELKDLSQEQRDFINGLGGLRMHSSNDFRIDYVLDYFQFMADMAVNHMFGHTYTKSPEFVRIFGNSGYKINMSIAAYEDSRGIRPNADEGFDWTTARELREAFPNAGVMLMATSDAQIQFALDNDWIDMCIPFHHSGLPKAIWYEMRAWSDYSSTQNEKFLNATEMRKELKADGVAVPNKLTAAAVEKMYIDHFNIKILRGKDGKRMRPHFLPGPTPKDGVIIPGHNNDYDTYIRLCREYGVHPRFYGIKVKDNTPEGGGREVDITEHPGYMKFIKETARTDSPQTAIEFNFDQPSEALGGRSPIEYALEELKARAQAESEMAGGPVRNIYESYKQDPYGIVPQFINGVINHEEEYRKTHNGEELPLDYLTPDSRKWFMTERKALESAYKDFDTIPYHPHEYDENGNLIMTNAEGQPETDAEMVAEEEVANTMFREVTDPATVEWFNNAPKTTGFRTVVKKAEDTYGSPMAGNLGQVKGKKKAATSSFMRNVIEQAEENPDIADENGKVKLIKPKREDGKKLTDVGSVDYNPYIHLRLDKINRQFKDAWKRDDLIYIESEVPVEEVPDFRGEKTPDYSKSPYHAEKAALPVGIHDWNGGALMLSRYDRPFREVPWEEVADAWAADEDFQKNGVHFDIVPPQMRDLLTERGIEIIPPHNGMGQDCFDAYNEWKGEKNGPGGGGTRFREANRNQLGFVSNADAALDRIKMDKATPEQWVKMLEKEGGLKAGEDKWLGLSDWLKSQDRKSITKDEIADYIDEHRIVLAEADYMDAENLPYGGTAKWNDYVTNEFGADVLDAFNFYEGDGGTSFDFRDEDKAAEVYKRLQKDFGIDHEIETEPGGEYTREDMRAMRKLADEIATYADSMVIDANPINSTRIVYTTEGLDNKREIALVVPTIESWNANDTIHFGDAGNGRAVAWARFGETTDEQGNKVLVIDEIQSKRHQEAREQGGYKDDSARKKAEAKMNAAQDEYDKYTQGLIEKYGGFNEMHGKLTPEENAESQRLYTAYQYARIAFSRNGFDPMEDEEYRRLVAEQQAHENSPEFQQLMGEWRDAMKAGDADRVAEIQLRLNPFQLENQKLIHKIEDREAELADEFRMTHKSRIPAAPFEKNWHELAMKRMLRLAAEEGYDYVAWTTGDQQAERYNIGGKVDWIQRGNDFGQFPESVFIKMGDKVNSVEVDENGTIVDSTHALSDTVGKPLSDLLGKELANKIMAAETGPNGRLEGDGFRVGGEGMKGFYDDILPRFMNKYGRKWGVKVQDITLPNVEEAGRVMHAVPVTQEMKESVMQGQTMFRERVTPEQDKEYMDAVNAGDMEKAGRMVHAAAYAAGYTIHAYHGTDSEDGEMPFTVFKDGHFTDDYGFASYYNDEYIYDVYIKMDNPLEYDFKGQNSDWALGENGDRITTHRVFNRAVEEGYDGVILTNVDEYGNGIEEEDGEYPGSVTDYIPATPNQIKSAEPVTYDDNGNVIPLSERFNPENNDIRFREAPTEEQQKEARIVNAERQATEVTLDRMGEQLGVKINRVTRDGMPAGHKTDKGYYDPATGEMTICMDNVTDERDAIATVLHETVGHKGLRELFGDRFREAMTNIYASLDREGREWVNAYITRHNLGFGEDGIIRGMEEYMSHLAESGNYKTSVWERIKEILGKVVDLVFGTNGFVFTDRELNYILRASYEHLKNPEWLDTPLGRAQDTLMKRELGINESDPNKPTDPDGPRTGLLFRDGSTGVASADYERDMNLWHTAAVMENQNGDLPVKYGMERILQEMYGDQWEEKMKNLPDDEDYLTRHNIASSRAETEAHNFELFHFTPLLEQVREIQSRLMGDRKGKEERQLAYERIIDYMYAVSGLERNAWKNAQVDPAEQRDWSGITSLMGRPKEEWQEAEADARAMIDAFRAEIGDDAALDELWNRVRSCTDFSLEHAYKYGLLTREEFERLHGTSSRPRLWNFYLPLRGFAEETAEDLFDYASYMGSSDGSAKTLEKAKGRWTEADNPLAYILRIAEAEIVQGNDNWAKQALYRFTLANDGNSLLAQTEPWYVKDPGTGKWVIAEPLDIDPSTGKPETLEDFEARMQALRAADPKAAKKGRRGLKLDQIMANKGNRNQHMIRLKVGGVDKRIWVNGDPSLAKAVNGWGRAKNMQWLRRAGRVLSNLFTTYSIDFTAKNLIRDTIYSRVALMMKEDSAYRHRFSKNWWSNFGYGAFAFPMVRLAARWESGELQRKPAAARTEKEQMFIDFMTDGGQTGYTLINSINEIKRRLERSMRRSGKDVSRVTIPILGHYAEFVKTLNEGFELLTRFTAYQTSRQMGRSGQRSASDAKEISVNFNRRGAQSGEGIWGNIASYLGATHYFYNAGVQGFDNFLRLFKAAPVKMSVTTVGLAMMGILTPMINSMLAGALAGAGGDGDGDGDDDWYWNVPEWVRRNNIIIGAGNWYLAVPLPVEFRSAYGLGDIAGAAFCYQKTPNRTFGGVTGDMLATAANILPVNPIEGYSGSGNLGDALIRGVFPDAGVFFVDWATNRDYTGRALWKENPFNDTVPKSQGAFASTPKGIIRACQGLAQISGGKIDVAPGLVRDFMNNYGGGFFRAAEDVSKIITGAIGNDPDRPFRWDNIPFFSGFTGHIDKDRSNSFAQGALREYQDLSEGNVKTLNAICNTDELTAAKVYGDPEDIPEEYRARVNAWKALHPKEYELGKMYREGMNNQYKMKQYVRGEKKGQWYKSNEVERKGVNTLKKEWKDLREMWLSMPENTPEEKAEKAEMDLMVQEAWHLYYNAEADLADKLMDFEYGK